MEDNPSLIIDASLIGAFKRIVLPAPDPEYLESLKFEIGEIRRVYATPRWRPGDRLPKSLSRKQRKAIKAVEMRRRSGKPERLQFT